MTSMHKPKVIDAALTYGTFPVVFGSVMGIGVYGMAQGWDPVVTAMSLTGLSFYCCSCWSVSIPITKSGFIVTATFGPTSFTTS